MKTFLVFLLRTYKALVTPILVGIFGHGCKFTPSCSEYMGEAIERFGVTKGLVLGTKRFLKCHPFSRGNFDPVPAKI